MTTEQDAETEKTGTFLVTHADDDSAVLSDVTDSQVHTLSDNPGLDEGDVVDATVAPDPPMGVTYRVVDVADRRRIPVEASDEPPTRQARDLAADLDEGDLVTRERAGVGELHVLAVPADRRDAAVEDVLSDQATVERAARLDVNRVEVRAADGVLSVRYLP